MNGPEKRYVSAMIKVDTHKNLKQLALDLGMPLTQVIDLLYKAFKENHVDV